MRALLLSTVLLTALPARAEPSPYDGLIEALEERPDTVPLHERFAPPEGFERVAAPPGSFAAWLRALPLRTDRIDVLAHDGRPLVRPSAAVVLMDVGRGDLQQCADTAIRLHAEWLWASGRAEAAVYHFTSGDPSRWTDWRAGERFAIEGSRVERLRGAARPDTHRGYRAWLQYVFRFAGTASLHHDSDPVPEDAPLRAGDVFVEPGSPGHAVTLLDLAEHEDGRRVALIGQGFMPAEDLHVLTAEGPHTIDGVWFLLPGPGQRLDTPSWRPFARSDARRWNPH